MTAPTDDLAPNPDAVLQLVGVTVRRGAKTLLGPIDWTVEEDERWAVLGPNGAGKTTLLQLAAASMHPSSGVAYVLGERLGRVDVFELRTRIGLASAALADRIPRTEKVADIVVSAGYAVLGRWRENYSGQDLGRAADAARARRHGRFRGAHLGHPEPGRESPGRDRPRVDDRPGAAAAGRARRRAWTSVAGRTCCAGSPASPRTRTRRPSVLVTHHVEELPPGISHVLLLRDARAVAAGLARDVLTPDLLSQTFGLPLDVERRGGRWYRPGALNATP